MKRITEEINAGKVLVSDGGWGTLLQGKGLQPGECPELWCIEHRNEVFDIAKSYCDVHADLIATNSFGANYFKLSHYGLKNRVAEINTTAAEISREATGNDKYVIGSVGPTGKMIIMGDVTEEEIYWAFKEQMMALEKGGVDSICIETMTALDEACIAIKAAKENTNLEIICTFTFDKTVTNEFRTMMGVSPTEFTETVISAGADIIGTNCGNGIENMVHIVKEIRTVNNSIPVLVNANAGLPVFKNGKTVFPATPEEMAAQVPVLIEAGANIIGGCCGTTPEHIRLMAEAIKR